MPSPLADRFRRWYRYERDVHDRVMTSLESVPDDRRKSAEYRKAVDLMAHLVIARTAWLTRIAGEPPISGPLFPQDRPIERVREDRREVEDRWSAYLSTVADEDLARVIDYKMFDGTPCTNTVEDMLTQLFGHSSYHRGQIAVLVRAAGGTPASTDFIHWVRAQPA